MGALESSSLVLLGALACATAAVADPAKGYESLGRPLGESQLAGWNIDVAPDGTGLPPGQGTVAAGEKIYKAQCVACHGAKLEGGTGPALAGGQGSLATAKPLKTIGSYWPYATTVFDYVRRAMPFQAPQSLSNDDVYSITAYLLHANGIVPEDATMDAKSLPAVKMPNRDGFYRDDRPDSKAVRCMAHCLETPAAQKPETRQP
jgi:cytochrome c